MLNSKIGSVPITVFTILALVLFLFALVSFALFTALQAKKVSEPIEFAAKSMEEKKALEFLGEKGEFVREKMGTKGYWMWKEEYLEMRVEVTEGLNINENSEIQEGK